MKALFKSTFILIFVAQSYAQQSDFSNISFKKADSIVLSYKGEKLNNLPELSYKLTAHLKTDVEKFRAIFKWVCENIANDYSQYMKNKRKRYRYNKDTLKLQNWNTHFKKRAFKRLLRTNKATCTGYAYLVKELSKHANITCEIINGYARASNTDIERLIAPNHSWNAVKLNNKWYLCDPTWASGIQDPETLKFVFKYNDGYFLANPELFAVNHFPENPKWLLNTSNTASLEDFKDAPVLYGGAYEYLKTIKRPLKMYNELQKNEPIDFVLMLKGSVSIKDVNFLIDSGQSIKKVTPNKITIEEGALKIQHSFKHKGFYDAHLFIGDTILATYVIRVKRAE